MSNCAQNALIDHRLASIARVFPHQIALVKPSKTQLRVLNEIGLGEEVISEQISTRCKMSPAWASTTLRRLTEKGYLQRRATVMQSGGVIYIYRKV